MKTINTIAFVCFLILFSNIIKAQNKTLYIIDSVAYFDNTPYVVYHDKYDTLIHNDEIANYRIITNFIEIEKLGYSSDSIVIINTKEMLNRPNELRIIPNIRQFTLRTGIIFDKELKNKYTGPFVDYSINGALKRKGFIKDGIIDGKVAEYDKKGRINREIKFKNGFLTNQQTEYWPNGNVRTKVEIDEDKTNKVSDYTSNGSLIYVYTLDKNSLRYLKPQKNDLKKFTSLFPKYKFLSKTHYKTFFDEYKIRKSLYVPKSYITYFSLGTSLFRCGEIENAIQMLDSAIILEPTHIDSRICRLYCIIFKYEFNNFKTISNFTNNFDKITFDSIVTNSLDLEKICQDIEELKKQGYNQTCECEFESYEGESIIFKTSLIEAEIKYCKPLNTSLGRGSSLSRFFPSRL